MGKIVFNSAQTTEKQKRFLTGRKQTIVNVKKDCKNLLLSEMLIFLILSAFLQSQPPDDKMA